MAKETKKFKISFSKINPLVLKTIDDEQILEIIVPSCHGKIHLKIKENEVIETDDPITQVALENYVSPELPIYKTSYNRQGQLVSTKIIKNEDKEKVFGTTKTKATQKITSYEETI